MSQSDYLAQKKAANILKVKDNVKNLGNVLDSGTLTNFKSYVLSNEVPTTNIRHNQLVQEGKQFVFGMEKPVRNDGHTCPSYAFCNTYDNNGNSLRENRVRVNLQLDNHDDICNSNIFSHFRSNISKNSFFLGEKREQGFFCFEECDNYFENRMGDLYRFDRDKLLRRS